MSHNEIAIAVKGLKKSYKNVPVLTRIDFQVRKGSVFALLGSNGAGKLMLLSLAGIILYIPFTIILMRKFKAMYNPSVNNAENIYENVRNQYSLLSKFFRLKKMYDWLAIPVSCFIITVIIFELYTSGGIKEHLIGSMVLFLICITIFTIATRFENKKRFKQPLNQLDIILKDMGNNQ